MGHIIMLTTAALLVGIFSATRYRGLWGETDTGVFARSIRAMISEGVLVPEGYSYTNGYGFTALATFLVEITGLSVAQLQIFGAGVLVVWIVLPAWLAYRALCGSSNAATLATVIIMVQPEFLFPILRGTHEKFTRGLMFMAFYLLMTSIIRRRDPRSLAARLVAFYLVVYALITFNNLFATSYFVALILALMLGIAVRWLGNRQSADRAAMRQRLIYGVVISLVLGFLFTFYAYSPARHSLYVVESVRERLALLFLEVEATAVNPFSTVSTAWVSPRVYLVVSIANWLLLLISLIVWLTQSLVRWRRRAWPDDIRTDMLWALYGAFGLLGAIAIIVDVSGSLATNLQHRVFPSFAMVAAALIAEWISRLVINRKLVRLLLYATLAITFAGLGIVGVAKATNEPLISTKWLYYTPGEFAALNWKMEANPGTPTWTEFDERLFAAMVICCAVEPSLIDTGTLNQQTRDLLVSPVTRGRGERYGAPLPVPPDSHVIYDNGSAQIYRTQALTPYQR